MGIVRKPTVGVEEDKSIPQRHLRVLKVEDMSVFEVHFNDDWECEQFINKCKHGNRLMVISDFKDIGYE